MDRIQVYIDALRNPDSSRRRVFFFSFLLMVTGSFGTQVKKLKDVL